MSSTMRRGRPREAAAVEIDLAEPDARQRTPVGKVLEPRQRRLAHQVGAALGRTAAGDLQGRIGAQRIDVVAVLVAGRDHAACAPSPSRRSCAGRGWDRDRRASGPVIVSAKPRRVRDLAQHDHAAVRRQATGIERGCERLARNG